MIGAMTAFAIAVGGVSLIGSALVAGVAEPPPRPRAVFAK